MSLKDLIYKMGAVPVDIVLGGMEGMLDGFTNSSITASNASAGETVLDTLFGSNELTANDIRDLQREEREAQWAFATSSAEKANQFTAEQAALNRQWQEQMSNTAYQRAVSDMKAAGLNPALLYNNMSGATTPAGSSAAGQMAQGTQASYSDVTATDRGTSIIQSIISVAGNALAAYLLGRR